MLTRRAALKTAAGMAVTSALAGCLGQGGGEGVSFHRNTKRPISSTTRFDAARFAGRWAIRGEMVHPGDVPTFGSVVFHAGGAGISGLEIHAMKRGGEGLLERYDTAQPAPGRIVVGRAPFDTQYWVLWVDDDYRTAAIGTPSGSFGWIIDRERSGGEDRVKAARDVLAFNGYDMSRLRTR